MAIQKEALEQAFVASKEVLLRDITLANDAVVKAHPCCAEAKHTFPFAGSRR